MPMPARPDALLFVSKPAAMPQRWQDAADRNRFDAVEKPEIGRDAFASYNHGGTVAVAIIWLAIYVVAVAQPLVAWSLSFISSLL